MEHLEHPDKGRTGNRENHEIQAISCGCRMSGYPNLRFSGEKVGHSFFPLPHYFKINVRFDSETGSASDPDPCQTWWEGSVSLTAWRGLFLKQLQWGKRNEAKKPGLTAPFASHRPSGLSPSPRSLWMWPASPAPLLTLICALEVSARRCFVAGGDGQMFPRVSIKTIRL